MLRCRVDARAEGSGAESAQQRSRKRRRPAEDELVPGARSRGVGAGGMEREGRGRLTNLTRTLLSKQLSGLFEYTNKRVAAGDEQNKPPIRDARPVVDAAAVDEATRGRGSPVVGLLLGGSFMSRAGGSRERLHRFLSKGLQARGARGLPA